MVSRASDGFLFALYLGAFLLCGANSFAIDFSEYSEGAAVESMLQEDEVPSVGIKSPRHQHPVEIVEGRWVCISDLRPDDVKSGHDSLFICFENTDSPIPLLNKICIKIRIKCSGEGQERTCTIELVPPFPIPSATCTVQSDPTPATAVPGKIVIKCEAYPGYRFRDEQVIPSFRESSEAIYVRDGQVCFGRGSGEESPELCIPIEKYLRMPGLRQLLPLLPGFSDKAQSYGEGDLVP